MADRSRRQRRRSWPSSSCRSRPARRRPRRRWARRSASTASTSWSSAKQYNDATQQYAGQVIPVELTIYEDRSFTFITKQPPAAELIKQAAGIEKGSGEPNRDKVATLTQRPGPRDRRAQDGRPERQRRRHGDAHHRRHGAEHGRGGGGMSGAGQALPASGRASSTASRSTCRPRRIKILKEFPDAKFDETVEVAFRLGIDPRKARPGAARHRVAAARHRASRSAWPCSRGREGARGRATPAPTSSAARSWSRRS